MTEKDREMEFPSNSFRSNRMPSNSMDKNKDKREKLPTVVTKKLVRKKSAWKKFLDSFSGDAESVGSYVIYDVLIPAMKSTITDIVSTGIEMLVYGESNGRAGRRDKQRSNSVFNYGSLYGGRRDEPRLHRDDSRRGKLSDINRIVIPSRAEAREVLDAVADLVEDYGQASVADACDAIGISSDFTDQKYGWTDLGRAEIIGVRGGYIVSFPKPRLLD